EVIDCLDDGLPGRLGLVPGRQARYHGVLGLGLRRVKLRNVGLENVQGLNAIVRPGFPVGLEKGAGQPRGIRLAPGLATRCKIVAISYSSASIRRIYPRLDTACRRTLRILSGVLRLQGLDVAQGPSGRSTPDRIQLN